MTATKPWNFKSGVYERDASGHHHYVGDEWIWAPVDLRWIGEYVGEERASELRAQGLQALAKEV